MLTIELQAIEQKISLLETITTVTDVPESESLKTKAIPKQTALGKEPTNPLKAEVLLKSLTKDNTDPSSLSKNSKLVHSSPSTAGSSKMTILSPNNLVQELIPDYLKAVKQDPIISHKNNTKDDINLINQFGLPFLKNIIEAKGTTKEAYFRQARQLFEEHSCIYCTESKDKEAGPSTPIKAVPTTEDESLPD
ncbi:hypothetical protein Tco_0857331 [Tanacetum coccineum]|uniref:Uncharacterized protein n=1 Tax=Tanacetum coccineum TaxID=301880 RepID=A0ABQ5BA75_9ASTR